MTPRRSSLAQVHRLRTEVNRLIDLLLDQPTSTATHWQPPLDLVEFEDWLELRVELPAVRADGISVELKDLTLHIRGTKARVASEPSGQRYHLMERFMGSFAIAVELPRPIHPTASSARLDGGLLVVTLPKLADRRHRCHPIEVIEGEPEHG